MLKPFYIKKKNINNRLVPPVSAADAGKLFGVDEEGNITLVEGGGGSSAIPTAILSTTEEETVNFGLLRILARADDTMQEETVNVSTIGSSLYEKLKPFTESPHYRGVLFGESTKAAFSFYFAGEEADSLTLFSHPSHIENTVTSLNVMFRFKVILDTVFETASMVVFFQKVN